MSDWPICYPHPYAQRGASLLLELCFTAACLSVLVFWLMPGLSGVSSRHQAAQGVACLEQSIQLAKNEALAGKRHMVLCGSSDGESCTPQRNWGPYWLMGEAVVASSLSTLRMTRLLRVHRIPPSHTVDFEPFGGGTPYYLSILPNGQTYNNGTFTYTYLENGKEKKTELIVNNLSRTYRK